MKVSDRACYQVSEPETRQKQFRDQHKHNTHSAHTSQHKLAAFSAAAMAIRNSFLAIVLVGLVAAASATGMPRNP